MADAWRPCSTAMGWNALSATIECEVKAYFHGGIQGLAAGDRLLPPSVTGTPTTADYGGAGVSRRDRVYATTELRFARVYAALAPFGGCGDVYEVELDAPIEADDGKEGGGGDSVCAPSATVVRVIERHLDLGVAREELAAQILALAGPQLPRRRPLSALSGLVGRTTHDFGWTGRASHLSGPERATTAWPAEPFLTASNGVTD